MCTRMKKIVTIVGARPQFIKAAPVSRALLACNGIEEVLVHTGQHFDENMSHVFFEQMDIPRPKHFLNIHSLSHGAMTGRMLEAIESILTKEHPDWVMVYGDTNSTLAGALAAGKRNIPVAHVEAGLRSFAMDMPEEINRILTDRVSRLLFCPTQNAMENLEKEGFHGFPCRMLLTGDVMYDASLLFANKARKPGNISLPGSFVLATVHRESNTKDFARLGSLIQGLNKVAKEMPVVFPVHPRTRNVLNSAAMPALSPDILATEPLGYLETLYLLKHCRMVLTDSGGMQKEAYFFKKPCITLRDETEWTELVKAGYNVLCGSDPQAIYNGFRQFASRNLSFRDGLYGNGKASAIIAEAFLDSNE